MSELTKHFDVVGLLTAVQQQRIGLRVTTNHPAGFRRILYIGMRQHPHLRCSIFATPGSASSFDLVKPGLTPDSLPTVTVPGDFPSNQAGFIGTPDDQDD